MPSLYGTIARRFSSALGRDIPLDEEFKSSKIVQEDLGSLDAIFTGLVEWGGRHDTVFLMDTVSEDRFQELVDQAGFPFLAMLRAKDQPSVPVLITRSGTGLQLEIFTSPEPIKRNVNSFRDSSLEPELMREADGEERIRIITCFPVNDIGSREEPYPQGGHHPYRAMRRFFRILKPERREIGIILMYAIMTGLIGLSLPLGVQSLIGFVSSGQVMTSVVVLIVFILIGVLVSGIMTIMQLHLVEYIHQRLFAKTAFAFAFRIPRIRIESVMKVYPPELMNRFFDTLSLMKGLSVILIDFSGAILQTVFGIILLSAYHPLFLLVGLVLVLILYGMIRLTGPKGLSTALKESGFKYKTANWLEEIARSLGTFKLAGKTNFALEKTDHYVSHYIQSREEHFKVLRVQYYTFVLFKTLVTALLLVLGVVLITSREINLGQFVAAEIVIILVINSIEKIILKLDTVYDVLVSVEKITDVTELPVETHSGISLPVQPDKGIAISLKDIRYRYPDRQEHVLNGVDLHIPSGDRICISGFNGSGKTTLSHLLIGLYDNYSGSISYNGISLRDLDKSSLLDHLGDYVSHEGIFDGTLLENIVIGRPTCTSENVLWAIEAAGLNDFVSSLPEGLNTRLIGGNVRISESASRKIIIARNIVERPQLLVLDDFLLGVERREKKRILDFLLQPSFTWTVVLVSNDPLMMRSARRLVLMKDGRVHEEGTFESLHISSSNLRELLNETTTA